MKSPRSYPENFPYLTSPSDPFSNQWQQLTSVEISMVQKMGVSENVVYPFLPNGFADHYPVF